MTQYIDKSILIEEIKKRIKGLNRLIDIGSNDEEKFTLESVLIERIHAYEGVLDYISTLGVLTLDDIKEMENHAFLHGIEVERNKNTFNDEEIKI